MGSESYITSMAAIKKWVGSKVGGGKGWGGGKVEGKWGQLYLNDNKKRNGIQKLLLFRFQSFKFPTSYI